MTALTDWCFAHGQVTCLTNYPPHALIEHCLWMCIKDEGQHECDIGKAEVGLALTKDSDDE